MKTFDEAIKRLQAHPLDPISVSQMRDHAARMKSIVMEAARSPLTHSLLAEAHIACGGDPLMIGASAFVSGLIVGLDMNSMDTGEED